jgi:hypothetical protein
VEDQVPNIGGVPALPTVGGAQRLSRGLVECKPAIVNNCKYSCLLMRLCDGMGITYTPHRTASAHSRS